MSDHPKRMSEDEAAEFAEQVFDVARKGDAPLRLLTAPRWARKAWRSR